MPKLLIVLCFLTSINLFSQSASLSLGTNLSYYSDVGFNDSDLIDNLKDPMIQIDYRKDKIVFSLYRYENSFKLFNLAPEDYVPGLITQRLFKSYSFTFGYRIQKGIFSLIPKVGLGIAEYRDSRFIGVGGKEAIYAFIFERDRTNILAGIDFEFELFHQVYFSSDILWHYSHTFSRNPIILGFSLGYKYKF